MILVKNERSFVTDDENLINAYKQNGFVEKVEAEPVAEKKPVRKSTKATK